MIALVEHVSPEGLARLPLFRRVSLEDRLRVAAVARVRTLERGEGIFQEGDASDSFVTVLTGRVKVSKMTPGGKDLILHIFGPGDPLGAVAVYDSRPYPASAAALEPTTCLIIPRQAFFSLLEQSPSLVRGLLSGLTHRLVELTERLAELMGAHVETRFARLFLKLAQQLGRAERGGVFVPLPLSRQELADLTGTTIETCIRIMSRWGKDDVLRTEKDGFVIVKKDALEALANA
ncbi:MAG TPA: Crp/Fnr family transcriptional regulator [Vicinamibacterales bacterium]|nr:Crp/Fnr family transcriptional regulator [Vicinamibacterales bacterium]